MQLLSLPIHTVTREAPLPVVPAAASADVCAGFVVRRNLRHGVFFTGIGRSQTADALNRDVTLHGFVGSIHPRRKAERAKLPTWFDER
jgi:hypothetical protein